MDLIKKSQQAVILSWNYKKTLIERLKKNNFKGKIYIFFSKTENQQNPNQIEGSYIDDFLEMIKMAKMIAHDFFSSKASNIF